MVAHAESSRDNYVGHPVRPGKEQRCLQILSAGILSKRGFPPTISVIIRPEIIT